MIKKLCEKDIIDSSRVIKNKVKKNFYIEVKPLAMKRVLLNILSNALSYSNKIVEVSCVQNINSLNIFIEDDGQGIPKNKRKEVFKAFYRIDESRQSLSANTGLGLTIAKDIIQSHGGRILLNSSELGGLKVEIALPRKNFVD